MSVSRLAVAALAACLTLSACKDDQDGPPQPVANAPAPPVANAGTDQSGFKGAVVTLDGQQSGDAAGRPLSYAWTQVAGPTADVQHADTPQPAVTLPRTSGTLRFRLVVTAGGVASPPDEVAVQVVNRPPVAAAGNDLAVRVGWVATLDGRASSDPDGDPLTYAWVQLEGPPVSQPAPAARTTFAAPATQGTLRFVLTVGDGEATSDDEVVVTVLPPGANLPPIASAGADLKVARRSQVTLDGSGRDPELYPVSFAWVQTGGPAVALTGAFGATAWFEAPATDADLEFTLAVSDGMDEVFDTVVVLVRNFPPVVWSVAITPANPRTADDLVASAQGMDPDGSPVTFTWAWHRNGVALPGRTSSVLSASDTAKGDVLTAEVTASDGELTAAATATATVADTPPTLQLDAPAEVLHGSALAAQVTVTDVDGDPLPTGALRLEYGPAGMTVAADGTVAWTPSLPMFDRTLDVRYAVALDAVPPSRVEGSVRVRDDDRRYPLRRTGFEIPVQHAGLEAADLDGDGDTELLVASAAGLYELARAAPGYAPAWTYPFAEPGSAGASAVASADLDGDGRREIFFSSGAALVRLDGVARREVDRASPALACRDLELADVDADGALELVCLAVGTSSYYDPPAWLAVLDAATLAVEWESAQLALGYTVAVGNVDGDVALELVTAGGYVFDGVTGANEWLYGPGFGVAADTGDLDADGVEEIVGIQGWSTFRVYSAVAKSPLVEQDEFDIDALLVSDVDGDARPEILIGDGQWGNVTAYRYDAATNALAVVWAVNSQDHGVTALAVGDLDADGAREVAWGSGASSSGADVFVVAGGSPIAVEWKSGSPAELDGFVGGRLARLGDGVTRLVFLVPATDNGYGGSRLVTLDPATGRWTAAPALGSSYWSTFSAMDVVDYDGDGVDEVFLGGGDSYSGSLSAYDVARGVTEWTSPADLGSALAITHADLTGDGSPDLVAMLASGHVIAFDVRNSTLIWKSTAVGTGYLYGGDVEAPDLDGDGVPEIVAAAAGRVVVFRKASSGAVPYLEGAAASLPYASDLVVADCDADGAPEVYALGSNYGSSGTVYRLPADLSAATSLSVGEAVSLHLEALGAGRRNLIVAEGSSAWGNPGRVMRAVDPSSGAEIWRSPTFPGALSKESLRYVDVDGDGALELVFATSAGMFVTR